MLTLLVTVQLSQRFWNSHAMINMSVWLRTEQPSLASALSRKLGINVAADDCLTQVRVVIGSPRQELGGMPASLPPLSLLVCPWGFAACGLVHLFLLVVLQRELGVMPVSWLLQGLTHALVSGCLKYLLQFFSQTCPFFVS